MSTTNVYFSQGTQSERLLIEDIIIESLKIYGQEIMYIPRTLVSKDEILGEDRLSQFKHSFPIEMYFENVDSFDGQGSFIQKFGLMVEQSATLVVARRRWDQMVGRYGATQLPQRPCEGDLIYFPLSKGLFEIKFVQHQDPFYQLGKLYVYKLQVELFQYASERIDTGIAEVDIFETLKTFSTDITDSQYGEVVRINVTNQGSGYTSPPTISFVSSTGSGAVATAVMGTGINSDKVVSINVVNSGTGYKEIPNVIITGDGINAAAVAVIENNIDKPDSFGDNNSFKEQANDILFNGDNPFGEVQLATASVTQVASVMSDSSLITSDSTTITADKA